MHRPNAFSRLNVMVAAMAALLAGSYRAMPGVTAATKEQAYTMLGGYKSNGKNKTATHDRGGTRAFRRAATKRRNVLRNRRAHRG